MIRFGWLFVFLPLSLWGYQTPPLGNVDFGFALFSGTGCPLAGTLKTLDHGKLVYEIEFDGFVVETGLDHLQNFERKVCNISIPVEVSEGFNVAVSKIHFAGFNILEENSTARVFTEAFFAGTRSPMIQKTFAESGNFSMDLAFSEAEKSWSPCNAGSNLRVSIGAQLNALVEHLNSSTKIDGKLIFQLEIRACK